MDPLDVFPHGWLSVFTTGAISTTPEYSIYHPWHWMRYFEGNEAIAPVTREINEKKSSQKPGPPSPKLMLSSGIVSHA